MANVHFVRRVGSVAVLLVFMVTDVRAGILNGHAAAFGGVSGSVPFNNGVGLSGTIDYAVFTAGNFTANFGGLGYVPGDTLVYTYQVFVTGSRGMSAEIVGVGNPANTPGTFDIGDVNALSSALTPNARWLFSPEVPSGMSSWGLAFSSLYEPIVGAALTVDGGTDALVAGVPTPGPVPFPEPGSALLLASGLTASTLTRRAGRRRGHRHCGTTVRLASTPAQRPGSNRIGLTAAVILCLGMMAGLSPLSHAGPLAVTNRALNDGFGPDAGRWHGSVAIASAAFGDTVVAQVDWAAFGPGAFQLFLNDQGIAAVDPSGAGEITYVYQIFSVTSAAPGIDTLTVGVDPTDLRGSVLAPSFVPTGAAGEKSPASGGDNTTGMAWFFNGSELHVGDTSSLLVFTSPRSPEFDFLQINSGLAAPPVSPLTASPSNRRFSPIPEPSSAALAGLLALAGTGRWAKGRRRP